MKTLIKISSLLIFSSVIFMACQKETSFEQGNSTASVGSLSVNASGDCLATVSGTYMKDTALKSSNYVDVSVNVDTIGTYTISTDTVMGFYFKATGTFATTGTQNVRLIGGGKPSATGAYSFRVTYNNTFCDFSVTVTAPPPPTGGSGVFTFNCTGATPVGTYMAGTALTTANTITLNVTVATAGTWSVTTSPAVNGITFSGSGTFPATGPQAILLTASGTPTVVGTNPFTVNGGTGATGACSFQVTTTAVVNSDYFPRTAPSNWSYEYNGIFNDSILIYSKEPTVTKLGNIYYVFMYKDGINPIDTSGYYRKVGSDYYEWNDMRWYVPFDNDVRAEFKFLVDNQNVGFTWPSTSFHGPITQGGSTVDATFRWFFTIVKQNVTFMVKGINYAYTIQVQQELQWQASPTSWQTQYSLQSYYARDNGLIKQDAFDPTGSPVNIYEVRRLAIY